MCGIFGYIGTQQQAGDIVLDGLKKLEYRGYDSWGVAVKKKDGSLFVEKHVGKIGDATLPTIQTDIGIGHTRWATHGGVTKENAHPHTDMDGKVVLVHNGIVENYLQLKKDLQNQGVTFSSETDTEVIANLLSKQLESTTDTVQAVRNTFKALDGRNALVILLPEQEEILVVKNGSPLVLGIREKELFVSSDAAALIPHTRTVVFLKDGTMAHLTKDGYTLSQIQSGKACDLEVQTLDWDIQAAEKGNYDHFLMKEIMEQHETIQHAAAQPKEMVDQLVQAIQQSRQTYLVGCGTAAHACRAGVYIASLIAKQQLNFCIGSEFAYVEEFIDKNSLIIAASQSGETADILDVVTAAQNRTASVAALVNVIGSSLNREADISLPLNAGPEIAVLSTKAFTAKLTLFFLIAYALANKHEEGKKQLTKTAEAAVTWLQDTTAQKQLKDIAHKIHSWSDIYILGRGLSYPIALEAAHKIKEASYIHAEGFAGGEPKHCEISLVSPGTPTIVFVPNDETKAAILSNAIEFKARGAYVIGIGPENQDVFDEHIVMPDVGITSSIIHVFPAQILAYYLALEKGNDPDKPRNLAKSVTVK